MRPLIGLALLVILAGCGRSPKIDPAFAEYVKRWESIYGADVRSDISFGNLTPPVVGQCGPAGITIVPGYWKNQPDLGKEELIFHELGHCELGLGHDRVIIRLATGQLIYRSVMYPYTFGFMPLYRDNIDYYHNELKTSTASEPIEAQCSDPGYYER